MFAPSELFSVRGRTALVTGGATGIGRICVEALLSAGARVLIASRKAEACEAAAQELSALGPCQGFGGTVATGRAWPRWSRKRGGAPTFCTFSSTTRA
jgi:NAD(P)-dependent dehydrogenase (short-subunit alcohol dehydrogenase family)